MIALDEPATVSIAIDGEARFATSKRVVWTSGDEVYVAELHDDRDVSIAQKDFAPNVARALRWLAPVLLGEPMP